MRNILIHYKFKPFVRSCQVICIIYFVFVWVTVVDGCFLDRPNSILRLRFEHFATECSWDHLYVYDGDSIYSPLLAAFRYSRNFSLFLCVCVRCKQEEGDGQVMTC